MWFRACCVNYFEKLICYSYKLDERSNCIVRVRAYISEVTSYRPTF